MIFLFQYKIHDFRVFMLSIEHLTISRYFLHWSVCDLGHEPKDGENRKSGKHAGPAVNDRNQNGVSIIKYWKTLRNNTEINSLIPLQKIQQSVYSFLSFT